MRAMRLILTSLVTLTLLAGATDRAEAGPVTGNPSTDGWQFGGGSTDTGVYIRGATTGLQFDIYTTSFQVDAGSILLTGTPGTAWQAGDTIVGMGAVLNLVEHADTIVFAKFGSATSVFTADSNGVPGPADGLGSFSAGHGGTGSIQFTENLVANSGPGALNNGGAWVLPPIVLRYDGGSSDISSPATRDLGRFGYLWNNPLNEMTSFEVLLNVDLLARLGYANGPAPGNKLDLNVSNALGSTDALARTPAEVPEPASLTLLGLGALGLAGAARRRRQAA